MPPSDVDLIPGAEPGDVVLVARDGDATRRAEGQVAAPLAAALRHALRDLGFLPPTSSPRASPELRVTLIDAEGRDRGRVDFHAADGFATLPGQAARILDDDVSTAIRDIATDTIARVEDASASKTRDHKVTI